MKNVVFYIVYCVTGIFWVGTAPAQNLLKVLSAQDGSPVFAAHVTLVQNERKSYCTTDENGVCAIAIQPGTTAQLSISHLSFEKYQQNIPLQAGENTVRLNPATGNKNPITITSNFLPQGQDTSVQKVTVIDAKRIEQQGEQEKIEDHAQPEGANPYKAIAEGANGDSLRDAAGDVGKPQEGEDDAVDHPGRG